MPAVPLALAAEVEPAWARHIARAPHSLHQIARAGEVRAEPTSSIISEGWVDKSSMRESGVSENKLDESRVDNSICGHRVAHNRGSTQCGYQDLFVQAV